MFDNDGYSEDNAETVADEDFHLLTRAQINRANDSQFVSPKTRWGIPDDDMCAHPFRGNLGYTECIRFSASKYIDTTGKYRQKAERDHDEMMGLRAALDGKGRPREKSRSSNVFMRTVPYRQSPLDSLPREEVIEVGFEAQISGREGFFILMSGEHMSVAGMLEKFRSRKDIEDAFRGLKHGIDLRPLR